MCLFDSDGLVAEYEIRGMLSVANMYELDDETILVAPPVCSEQKNGIVNTQNEIENTQNEIENTRNELENTRNERENTRNEIENTRNELNFTMY